MFVTGGETCSGGPQWRRWWLVVLLKSRLAGCRLVEFDTSTYNDIAIISMTVYIQYAVPSTLISLT